MLDAAPLHRALVFQLFVILSQEFPMIVAMIPAEGVADARQAEAGHLAGQVDRDVGGPAISFCRESLRTMSALHPVIIGYAIDNQFRRDAFGIATNVDARSEAEMTSSLMSQWFRFA